MRDDNLNAFDDASTPDNASPANTDIVSVLLSQPKIKALVGRANSLSKSDMKKKLVETINDITDEYKTQANEGKRTVALLARVYKEAETVARGERDAEIAGAQDEYKNTVSNALDELYQENLSLIREELDVLADPCEDGFDGELALITQRRDLLNRELGRYGDVVEKLGKDAKELANGPAHGKQATVEQGHSSTKQLQEATQDLDEAWDRHRDAEQALTILYVLTAKEPQNVDDVLEAHRNSLNGETQTDPRFEERVKSAVESRNAFESVLQDAKDILEDCKGKAQAGYEEKLVGPHDDYLDAVVAKESASANATLWQGVKTRAGASADNFVALLKVGQKRQANPFTPA